MAVVGDGNVLIVFARVPLAGRVKTRLAARIGDDAAARLYDAFVRDLVGRFSAAPFAVRWAVAPPADGFCDRFGLPADRCREQVGGDLGERMRRGLEDALAAGAGRCVLVGSDTPHLGVERVVEAFDRLADADLVVGPASDGGYYLIGMKEPHDVFSGVSWSTPSVLAETEARSRRLGLSLARIADDFDVDEWDDLLRLRAVVESGGVRCPATFRALRELATP